MGIPIPVKPVVIGNGGGYWKWHLVWKGGYKWWLNSVSMMRAWWCDGAQHLIFDKTIWSSKVHFLIMFQIKNDVANVTSSLIGWVLADQHLRHKHKIGPVTHFTNEFINHNWKSVIIVFVIIFILTILSGRNFAHATTAKLSWHVQNCDLIW